MSESIAGVLLEQPEGPEGAWDGIGSSLPQLFSHIHPDRDPGAQSVQGTWKALGGEVKVRGTFAVLGWSSGATLSGRSLEKEKRGS